MSRFPTSENHYVDYSGPAPVIRRKEGTVSEYSVRLEFAICIEASSQQDAWEIAEDIIADGELGSYETHDLGVVEVTFIK
jgi:hypothetical protein